MTKERMIKLLYELIKNSKRSDREIAKIIGVSQPTITRMRQRLEKRGYIQDYTIIPDMEKLGFEIAAFTFVKKTNWVKTQTNGSNQTQKSYSQLLVTD